jgi:hypothetical protein
MQVQDGTVLAVVQAEDREPDPVSSGSATAAAAQPSGAGAALVVLRR